MNSRLDELRAAVLRVRLQALHQETDERCALAAAYRARLGPTAAPIPERDAGHVYHLFPIRSTRRDALCQALGEQGVETLVHYPTSLSAQPAFLRYGQRQCPVSDLAASQLLSLPLRPGLTRADVERVSAVVNAFSGSHEPTQTMR